MPYIRPQARKELLNGRFPATAGELNFIITDIVTAYIEKNGLSYAKINEVIGVLACCQMEIYRRVAANYEDKKCAEFGDVIPSGLICGGSNHRSQD